MFSRRFSTVLLSFVLYPQDLMFKVCFLLTPQQTTTLQPINITTLSKRLQIIPAMVFIIINLKLDEYIFCNSLPIEHAYDAMTVTCIVLAVRNHYDSCTMFI
jgi:hypothetical protein